MSLLFTAMFPLPPGIPEGKEGKTLKFLNPTTDIPDKIIDRGIVDASIFVFHPNESKKWNDEIMDPYNYINMVDSIDLQGAKCFVNWEHSILSQIHKIHNEFYIGGLPYRTIYLERYNYDTVEEKIIDSPITIGGRTHKTDKIAVTPDLLMDIEIKEVEDVFEISMPVISNPLTDAIVNAQLDTVKIGAPVNGYDRPCTPVRGVTTAKYPPETRKWIHHLRYIHPKIDEKIQNLLLFKPVSEHMGENVITYNSDTNAVDVHNWKLPTTTQSNLITPYCTFAYPNAHILREIIRERMISEEPDEINISWTKLNSLMHDCMASEIDLTTEPGTGLWYIGNRDPRESHGLLYVNDIYHPSDYIDPIKMPVADALFAYLVDACQLVNHMYQLYNNVKSDGRETLYSAIMTKNVVQQWSIYERAAPESSSDPAPIATDFAMGRWGYRGTEVNIYDWDVNIGLEVEGTYPRKKLNSGQFNADLLGNKITNTVTNYIDDKHLIPETELVKPPIL